MRNPYELVMTLLGATLERFERDGMVSAFGFGDERTKDKSVFPLGGGEGSVKGTSQLLAAYRKTVQSVKLSGPTSFAALVKRAAEIAIQKKEVCGLIHEN